ncbi:MAG: LacI family transcriptional regulator [Actinobacteria bacterium]|nr:LacI family transcriptional regulator [Actinomycetota bacterium]
MVTYADVAREAHTSTAVVSYVLNNGPRPVSEKTRARVLAAAEALGYRPNRLPAALRTGKTGFVGVVVPDSSIPFFAELTRVAIAELGQRGLLALVGHAGLSGVGEAETIDALLSARVDGLVITAFWREDHAGLTTDVPVVYVHHKPPSSSETLVPSDNAHATRLAVEHLRSHGLEPDFWTGPDDEGPLGERLDSWRAGAAEGARLFRSPFSPAEASAVFRELVGAGQAPRSLVVATDQQAIGILSGAYEAGVRVPEDLALISLDGSPETEFTSPPLTVVRQPLHEMMRNAIAVLQDDGRAPEPALGRLVRRRSCGCAHPDQDGAAPEGPDAAHSQGATRL